MIGRQTIRQQPHRLLTVRVAQYPQKGAVILVMLKHRPPVVGPVEHVKHRAPGAIRAVLSTSRKITPSRAERQYLDLSPFADYLVSLPTRSPVRRAIAGESRRYTETSAAPGF